MSLYGARVLRVRVSRGAASWIPLTADAAAKALGGHGLRVVVDYVPPGYEDLTEASWTDDRGIGDVVRVWAGDDLADPTAARMVEAWSLAFDAIHTFLLSFELFRERSEMIQGLATH